MTVKPLTTVELDAINRRLGQNLRLLRLMAGLSQNDVAAILGISYQQVQKYETGRNRVSLPFLAILKGMFDIPYERFFDGISVNAAAQSVTAVRCPPASDQAIAACRKIAMVDDPALQKKLCRVIDAVLS